MTQFKNFIGGEWVDGNDLAPNVNPSDTSDVIGHSARASEDQTQKAIASARSAFRRWSLSTPQQRFDLLDQVGSTVLEFLQSGIHGKAPQGRLHHPTRTPRQE